MKAHNSRPSHSCTSFMYKAINVAYKEHFVVSCVLALLFYWVFLSILYPTRHSESVSDAVDLTAGMLCTFVKSLQGQYKDRYI